MAEGHVHWQRVGVEIALVCHDDGRRMRVASMVSCCGKGKRNAEEKTAIEVGFEVGRLQRCSAFE